MEYSWGYAAARTPPSSYHFNKAKPHADRPNRSNSTSGSRPNRKPRIPGHSRASSCSSNSLSAPELPPAPPLSEQQRQGQQGQGQTQGLGYSKNHEKDQEHEHDHASGGAQSSLAPGGIASAGQQHLHSHNNQHHQRRDRVAAAFAKYYQGKQLPATPDLDTDIAPASLAASPNESDSASPRHSVSPRFPRPSSVCFPPHTPLVSTPTSASASAAAVPHHDRRMFQHAAMFADPNFHRSSSTGIGGLSNRAESVVSNNSGATTLSSRTMLSSETPWGAETAAAPSQPKPLVVRNGRTYISDPTLPYPLPVDLAELHRQSLRVLLLCQLFGGPICSPECTNKPPLRVLEVGCGSGFWSMMCHSYFSRHGHSNISFTGIDIAPLAPGASVQGQGGSSASTGGREGNRASANSSSQLSDIRPEGDMKWRFVQHDMRKFPWPFTNGEFDLVMVKDMSLATSTGLQQAFMDEYLRVLSPGGTFEMWDSDHTIRMLRPHVPEPRQVRQPVGHGHGGADASADDDDSSDSDSSDSEEDEQTRAANLGAYVMTGNTPLSAPLNNFLVEYNGWVSKALEARGLSAMPCTLVGPMLLQEAETLTGTGSRRLAVPLSEARWEREGVGGVVTKDGKSYIETKGKSRGAAAGKGGRPLSAAQAALRRTALMTVVQQIQSLEGVLRETSGKSQDEWDGWLGKMMNDLVKENGTSWGECLEVGAWWAKKKS